MNKFLSTTLCLLAVLAGAAQTRQTNTPVRRNINTSVPINSTPVKTTSSATNSGTRNTSYGASANKLYNSTYSINMRAVNGKNIKVNIRAGNMLMTSKTNGTIPKQYKSVETDGGIPTTQDNGNGIITCRVTKNKLDIKSTEWDIISRSTTDNIAPGYVYDLDDIQNTGQFRQITEEREDANMSINAETVLNSVKPLASPDVASIIQARQSLLNTQATGTVRAIENTTVSEIYDETDFKLHTGFDVFSPTVSASGLFDFNNKKESIKYLMDYKAELFTIEYAPKSPGLFFKNPAANNKASLVYVDKVVYGVRIMVAFESELTAMDIGGSLDVNYRGPVLVNADLILKNASVFKNTSFRILGWGIGFGESGTIIAAKGVDDLKNKLGQMLLRLDNHSQYPSGWGSPVSYSLKNLAGNVVVANAKLEELPQRTCTISMKEKNIYKFSVDEISTGKDCDAYGHITVLCYENGKEVKPEYGMPNGDMAMFQNNNHLAEYRLYKRETDAGICGQTRSFIFNNPQNVKIRIWTWMMDYDGGSGDDPLAIIGGKPMSTINGDYYQDFYLRDLMALADRSVQGDLCKLSPSGITVNLQDDAGDSPLIIRIKVCNDYK